MKYDSRLLEVACKLLTSGPIGSQEVHNEASKYLIAAFTQCDPQPSEIPNPFGMTIREFSAGFSGRPLSSLRYLCEQRGASFDDDCYSILTTTRDTWLAVRYTGDHTLRIISKRVHEVCGHFPPEN